MAGEITTTAKVDFEKVARDVITAVGYTHDDIGFDAKTCKVDVKLHSQSGDIAMGVDREGAGDQGMMFGYACKDTPEFMPLPVQLAHRLVEQQAHVRRESIIPGLRPDAKSQVTVEYDNNKPVRVDTVVL